MNRLFRRHRPLPPLATKYKNDGKVDQVMINGHGNAKMMQSGGENGTRTNSAGEAVYGATKNEPLTVNSKHPKALRDKSDDFVAEIVKVFPKGGRAQLGSWCCSRDP